MVPFLDLKAQYQSIKDEIQSALNGVLESCQFALGSEVTAFEKEFGDFCHAQHAVAMNSGTSALHLALLTADIGPDDEVITTPMTFVATVAAIRYTGARPVFVDCDPLYYNIDVTQIEAAITPKTKAIIPVHLYGQPADMDPILEIANRYNLIVIEDAAQAHGAEYKGRRTGSIGDIGCFSFYPGKNLGAYGEGGCLLTNNAKYAEKARMMRDWGQRKKYEHVLPGYNYRMDGIQGAVLRVKLRHLEQWTEARRRHAARYSELLADSDVVTPAVAPEVRHVFHIYALRSPRRDAIQAVLGEHEVQSGRHYPDPVHLLPVHSDLGYKAGDFPVSEQLAREELSLPMYAELTKTYIEQVASAVAAAV
ncbi:MAG: DegT/DnrJ/EryC1/StrS family aminotransferase [Planctomycetota bacterium]